MGRLTPMALRGRLPEPAPHPVTNRYATYSEVSHVTVSHALRWHGCAYRVHCGRLCRPSTWRRGRLPRHDRHTAVRYRQTDPATALEEYAACLRLRSRPLWLLAL